MFLCVAHRRRRRRRRLRDNATGAVFGVATYHMPCAFRTPAVMAVHMALCAQRAFAVARGCPFVLCGDFNIQPVRCCVNGKVTPPRPAAPVMRAAPDSQKQHCGGISCCVGDCCSG